MGLFDRFFRRGKKDEDGSRPLPPEPSSPPPEWAAFFRTGERYERFESVVRSYFKGRGKRALIIDGQLRVGNAPGSPRDKAAGEQTFGLGNLAQVCAISPEAEWAATVALHFERMARSFDENSLPSAVPFEEARDRLGVRLWDMPNQLLTDLAVWREEIPGLASVLFIDSPESITTVRREDAVKWGKSDDELFETALANLPTLAPLQRTSFELPEGHTLNEFLGESPFSCSFALLLDGADEVGGPHGFFFSVPSRHRVLTMAFLGIKSLHVLSNFMSLTQNLEREGPGSISARVYWRHEGVTLEVPYALDGDRLSVTPPGRLVEYLNELAEREGDEAGA